MRILTILTEFPVHLSPCSRNDDEGVNACANFNAMRDTLEKWICAWNVHFDYNFTLDRNQFEFNKIIYEKQKQKLKWAHDVFLCYKLRKNFKKKST